MISQGLVVSQFFVISQGLVTRHGARSSVHFEHVSGCSKFLS